MSKSELLHVREISVEAQLAEMEPSQLWQLLYDQKRELEKAGVKQGIDYIFHGASRYGQLYEDRRYDTGGIKLTPLNCLMAVLHGQPKLRDLPTPKFEQLATTISEMCMTVQELYEKIGRFEWPSSLTRPSRFEESE